MLVLLRELPRGGLSLKIAEVALGGVLDKQSSTDGELRIPKFGEAHPRISHLDSVVVRMSQHAEGGSRCVRDELSSPG